MTSKEVILKAGTEFGSLTIFRIRQTPPGRTWNDEAKRLNRACAIRNPE